MTEYFGPGVSRVLESADTQYALTIWQKGKPPTDADLNLSQTLNGDAGRNAVQRDMPSGFLGNETNTQADFLTNSAWSNWFKFGTQRSGEQRSVMWANVNGWLIPVVGTRTGTPPGSPNDTDTPNVIALDPPPSNSGDFRIDYAFLEVWMARVQPNPSTTNKPAANAIYRYGNVEGGASFLPDDLVDPEIGFETNQRVQVQYRVRVVKGLVGLTSNPDGFDPVVVKAQGAAATPTSFTFTNMRQTLGDPGLWRAGDGTQNSLGSVDGYAYAVPIAAIFRRNSVTWNGEPAQNLNGGFNRNPTAVDRTGIKTFSTIPSLGADLSATATSATLAVATNLPLPTTPSTPVLIQIGDELMTYTSITGTTINGLNRGVSVSGTVAEPHKSGSTIRIMAGRPDGLFSDQVANTDILDLRHAVNPNGFDYDSLLKSNLDKLLRGKLRATWKRSGGGPQGPFVAYQDAIKAGGVSLGVTKLDAPDNIRLVFSDAATTQPIECVVAPNTGVVPPGPGVAINVAWSLSLTVNTTNQSVANQFTAGDIIVIPVNQLKTGLPGGDTDQVRWLNDSVSGAIRLRLDGETGDLPSSMYTVTPAAPGPSDDLVITLGGSFPSQLTTTATPTLLHIRVNAVYGAGRGLSRRPDSLHSVSYINPSADLLVQGSGVPLNNQGSRVAWAPLWSKYRNAMFNGQLPVTSEVYADLGSKTLLLTPFRRVNFPNVLTIDGNAANPVATAKKTSSTGFTLGANSPTLNDTVAGTAPSLVGDAVVVASGPGAGTYVILALGATSYTLDRPIKAGVIAGISYTVHSAQGVMPLNKKDNVTPKWTTTDPLNLFCGTTHANANQKNIYVSLPRHLIPGWGELRLPILATGAAVFSQGVNFLTNSRSGASGTHTDADKNFVNYTPNSSITYAGFSTQNLLTVVPATYNTAFTYVGNSYAGIRFFTDTRGLGRQGLELPPFYGIARMFAVYEAADYIANGSAFDFDTRAPDPTPGRATNLLRQNMAQADGPVFWVELDDDGDSTFVLNANAIDLSRSPNAIASFSSGNYVIEASVFGFDRGSFDLNSEFRLVMTRPLGANSWSTVGGVAVSSITRASNINKFVAGPSGIIPGPAEPADQIVVNFSRTPYQGDAWGSQTNYIDISYTPGAMTSGTAFQIASTTLNQNALTRPNQKVLEVLSSVSFTTTLGTGRYAGDASVSSLIFTDVGYENPAVYPPTSGVDPRPVVLPGVFTAGDNLDIGTEYLGCTERLPMGALYRDKDFRGQAFNTMQHSALAYWDIAGNGKSTGLAVNHEVEQIEVTLDTSSSGVGSPGDALVHVDGEQGNYSLLVNFRVHRGGSIFTGNGSHPGGEVALTLPTPVPYGTHTNVLQGRAMLVRNTVTNVGATEVSAGNELMMLILTNVQQVTSAPVGSNGTITIGTNGAGEGYSAADLYRIEGHPLTRNNVRMIIDPTTIALSRKA